MKKILPVLLLVIATLITPNAVGSAAISLSATLSGAQEVPPVATSGTGSFTGTLNEAQTEISFTLTASGLTLSRITASHIHVAPVGVNGPIILFLFNRATEGVFTGTKSGILTPASLIPRPAVGVNNFADAVQKILTGNAYVNLHTDDHPGGEIRGQVEIVVSIDIKPGSDPNSINTKSSGVIPVAILSSTGFDAGTVDTSTVTFGRTGTEASPAVVPSSLEDVDDDGDLDMVLMFRVGETGLRAGDTSATLKGKTSDGGLFTGSDSVRAFFPGDVDGDLDVDIMDASLLAYAYDSVAGSALWNPYADFDLNDTVDILDASELGYWFDTSI